MQQATEAAPTRRRQPGGFTRRLEQIVEHMDENQRQLLACDIADSPAHLVDNERSKLALKVKRDWLKGKVSDHALEMAHDAACEEWEQRGHPLALGVTMAVSIQNSNPVDVACLASMAIGMVTLIATQGSPQDRYRARDEAIGEAVKRYTEMASAIIQGGES